MLSQASASTSDVLSTLGTRFEGRTIKVGGKQTADLSVQTSSGILARPVYFLDSVQIKDVSHVAQRTLLDQGYFINGATDLVEPFGEICITKDLASFRKWLGDAVSIVETDTVRITTSLFEDLLACVKRIPAAAQWSLIIGTAVTLLG